MQITKKLYDLDAYETDFEATVISCEKTERNNEEVYAIILDQTLFFPEEGGQSPDKGDIDGVEVIDVQIDNDIITHYLKTTLKEGSRVHGRIDFKHRFSNMQQHSGEHIFSGLVHTKFAADNVGFHLSDNSVTMDFNKALSPDDIKLIESLVNEAIVKNIEIETGYPDEGTLKNTDYRSKKEIDGPVRLVTIPGYDICACCAPHVKRTGEIGILKVMNVIAHRGGVRVSILCGFRALEAFREELSITDGLVDILTTGRDKLTDSVKRLKEENISLSLELNKARQALLEQKIQAIDPAEKDVFIFEKDAETVIMRNIVNQLTETREGICGFFKGDDEAGYSFIIGSSSLDMNELAKLLREKFSAKGGGSKEMIQGQVRASEDEIKKVILNGST